jgi:Toprim domain-containing protein
MSRDILTLADLDEYDPGAPERCHREKRFLCPLCGDTKPQDDAHRSLSLNQETGGWRCHRCDARGYVPELRQPESSMGSGYASRSRTQLARAFAVPALEPAVVPMDQAELQQRLKGLVALQGSGGEYYLLRRGIPVEIAAASRVKYHYDFSRRPAVVFGIYDGAGQLVAAHGRYTDGRRDPAMRTIGEVSAGVFATTGALEAKLLAIVEAPIDALSLSACGVPALALLGTHNRPAWLPRALAGRTVLVATDSDEPGEKAAAELTEWLRPLGTRCWRLRPTSGKDWNEVLCAAGQATLTAQLADSLASLSASPSPAAASIARSSDAPTASPPSDRVLPGDRLKSEARRWLCHACLLYFAETELLVIEDSRFGRLRCSSCYAGEPLSPDQGSAKAQLLATLKVDDPMERKAEMLRQGVAIDFEYDDLDFIVRYAHFIPADCRAQILESAKYRARLKQVEAVWLQAHEAWCVLSREEGELRKGAGSAEQLSAIEERMRVAQEKTDQAYEEVERFRQRHRRQARYSRYGK